MGLFLRVEDFDGAYERMRKADVEFVREPREEPYGWVAVFLDVAGNRWDLLGPRSSDGRGEQETGCGGGRLDGMPTLVRDPQPVEFKALLERRHRLGQDLPDEVWEGIYHMNPAPNRRHAYMVQQVAELLGPLARAAGLVPMMSIFNLGDPSDYRVPDGGLVHPGPDAVYVPTAALVLEVVSPDDETWHKLGFYAARGVGELLIVDAQRRRVDWLSLSGSEYTEITRSALIDCGPAALADRLDWPD